VEGLRSASGFEGIIVIGVIFFVLNVISKAKQAARSREKPFESTAVPRAAATAPPDAISLESVLKQIETMKQQKDRARVEGRSLPQARRVTSANPRPAPPKLREVVQDARGPLGRISLTRIESAEDVEDRTSLEDEGALVAERRLRDVGVVERRPDRVVVDRDDAAAMIAQRRVDLAEARNRPHAATDHAEFDQQIRKEPASVIARTPPTVANLREAMVWREILGPPKALQDD
jgi:hypothetical protein